MNIDAPIAGRCEKQVALEGSAVLLDIPLRFNQTGILKIIRLESVSITRATVSTSGDDLELLEQSIRSYVPKLDGDEIQLPLALTNLEQKDTTFVLRLLLKGWKPNTDRLDLVVEMEMTFSTFQTIAFRVKMEPRLNTKSLKITGFSRARYPIQLMLNVFGVLALVAGAFAWNYVLNADVHRRLPGISQDKVALAIGVGLTFVGMALSQVRSWFRTLLNFASFMQLPELHFEPTAANIFSTRGTSAVVSALILAGIVGAWLTWTVTAPASPLLPHHPEFVLSFDNQEEVSGGRLYSRLVRQGAYQYRCGKGPSVATLHATGLSSKVVFEDFSKVQLPSLDELNLKNQARPLTLSAFVTSAVSNEVKTAVIDKLCGRNKPDASFVHLKGQACENTVKGCILQVENTKELTASEIDDRLNQLLKKLNQFGSSTNYENERKDAEVQLTEWLELNRGRISPEILADYTVNRLSEIRINTGTRRAVTMMLSLRALTRATRVQDIDSIQDRPDQASQVKKVVDQIKKQIKNLQALNAPNTEPKADKAVFQSALDLLVTWEGIAQPSDSARDNIHSAIIGMLEVPDWWKRSDAKSELRSYLQAVLVHDLQTSPQREKFFKDALAKAPGWAGNKEEAMKFLADGLPPKWVPTLRERFGI